MDKLTIFKSDRFGQVRTTLLDGEVWFVGKDVAEALGYSNTNKAILDHVDEEDKVDGVTFRDPIGRDQRPVLINESGVYALTLSSKLPQAREFKRWVTKEVIPSIRKTGGYSMPVKELNDEATNKQPSIVTRAKTFTVMMRSMCETMDLSKEEKKEMYRSFFDSTGMQLPSAIIEKLK